MDVNYTIRSSGGFLIMDNDSGYVSNNLDQESNSDSVTESLNNSSVEILKSFLPKSIYISEDALLERPDLDHTIEAPIAEENTEASSTWNNIVNSNVGRFDSFQSDSGSSTYSVIVPVAKPIYYDLNNKVNSSPPISNEDENISSNPSDGPFFGYENVPMESTNRIFQNGSDTCSNVYSTHNRINTLFLGLRNYKPDPLNSSCLALLEPTTAIGEVPEILNLETTITVEKPSLNVDSPQLNSTAFLETHDGFVEKHLNNLVKDDSLINIEELPVFIQENSTYTELPNENTTSCITTALESLNVIELSSPKLNNSEEISDPCNSASNELQIDNQIEAVVSIPNEEMMENKDIEHSILENAINDVSIKDDMELNNMSIDAPTNLVLQSNEPTSLIIENSVSVNTPIESVMPTNEVTENRILTNLTNTSIYDNSEPGPSKIPAPQRRNSTKNKENVKEREVYKTPSKSRKRKFSEVGSPCDLFSDSESTDPKPLPSPKVVEEKYVHNFDHRLLKRVRKTLSGVPPPPDMTISRLSVNDILEKLEANKSFFWTKENLEQVKSESSEMQKASLNESHNSSFGTSSSILIDGQHEEVTKKTFPEILNARHHGLHHNRSKLSEEIEHLCDKYGQRYIGAETQSTCNAVEAECTSPSKRRTIRPKWAVKSPGRRLSHLAKRRITFSSASLQAGTSSSAASRARQILIDYKKLELLNKKKSPRKIQEKSPRKTPFKSPAFSPGNGRTPSSSAKKKLRMRFRLLSGDFKDLMAEQNASASNSKRALFQSPNKDGKLKPNLSNSASAMNSFQRDLVSGGAKRSLFSSPNKIANRTPLFPSPNKKSPFKNKQSFEKKRKRDDDDIDENISKQPKFFRSQSSYAYAEAEPKPGSSLIRTKSESVLMNSQTMTELSAANKKKLQWAVYDSLKDQNISTTHPQFKVFASVLARVIRRCIAASNIRLEASGTSEKMLRIARHHVYAVVKGKSVDEIMGEVNRNKARNIKPRGYIAPQDYNPGSISQGSALKDRDSNSDSSTKSSFSQPSVVKTESRIDRIRKVINFEDNR